AAGWGGGRADVGGEDEHERHADDRRPAQPLPSAAAGDEREHDGGDDECDPDGPDRRRQAEQPAADREDGKRERALPQEQHDRSEDERLEQGLRHDVLLDLQLVGVEQDGYRRQNGYPTPLPESQGEDVDRDTHRQPDDVLHGGDDGEVRDREDRAQQQ